jgi:hypothetical protein
MWLAFGGKNGDVHVGSMWCASSLLDVSSVSAENKPLVAKRQPVAISPPLFQCSALPLPVPPMSRRS